MDRRLTVIVATVLVFVGVAALLLLFGSMGRGAEGGAPLFGPRVAIVELEGLIAETDDLVRELRQHRDNPSVRAVVIRINSPGGVVAPTQEVYDALLRVREAKDHSDSVVARADGVEDRTAAEALKGARVFVPRSSFPTASEDEYYWVDLMGLDVVNREGVALGRVKDLLSTGPQTVLVIAFEEAGKPQERMIPFVSAYVDQVDLQARRITVDWQPDY